MPYKFAFDLDGTLTRKEILPVIAEEIGIGRKMAELTKKTMDGLIPFDISFRKRVEMLKNIPISRAQTIISRVPISRTIWQFIKEHPGRCFIVTQNLDVWIKKLVAKIGIPCYCSKADYRGDRLLGIQDIFRKKDIHHILDGKIVAVGEGNNDVEMLLDAGISIAYGGVHWPAPTVLEICDYAIFSDKELCRFLRQLS